MLKGFKDFLMRGNVVDLAVAVIIGAAFGGIVTALSKDFIGGIIGIIGGTPRFDSAKFTVNGSDVVYGSTITAAINFVIVAAVIYFVIVAPMKRLQERFVQPPADADTPIPSDEAVLLTEIRDLLRAQEQRP
ncbi:large conductance mechanosensitive channel protein MscL [Conexibacter sp. SYSU D00693]|uniref:large conductance mechanosensitive channel protein MscL n=1 Tax=Conexibacter sp. SYSU D00693 TaxID=2812560 RepID=UPI00196B02C3|nr:large conductance mechanosensitive channel protein MscL [Conexibacter sp. SYSU D00693]